MPDTRGPTRTRRYYYAAAARPGISQSTNLLGFLKRRMPLRRCRCRLGMRDAGAAAEMIHYSLGVLRLAGLPMCFRARFYIFRHRRFAAASRAAVYATFKADEMGAAYRFPRRAFASRAYLPTYYFIYFR